MKLALLGDVALFGNLSLKNNDKAIDYFRDVEQYLSSVDLVVGNLESPFSEKQKTHGAKSAYLYSEPDNIRILKYLHIDLVNLANNHIMDYGKEGCNLTKSLLYNNKIGFFGIDGKEIKIEADNNKLAFSGFCCYSSGPLGCVKYGKLGVNEYDLKDAINVIERNYNEGYLNIVSVHAGIEHVNYPSVDTIKAARILAERAPIVYYGHHPHVAQGIEKQNGSIIAYSLGNFCFDDVYSSVSTKPLIELSENNRSTFILEINIDHNKIISYNIIPIYIGKDKMIVGKGVDAESIFQYTNVIKELNEKDYTIYRNSLIQSYLQNRVSQRDVMWYIKRLRPRYLKMILNSKIRKIKYNNKIKKYLEEYESNCI